MWLWTRVVVLFVHAIYCVNILPNITYHVDIEEPDGVNTPYRCYSCMDPQLKEWGLFARSDVFKEFHDQLDVCPHNVYMSKAWQCAKPCVFMRVEYYKDGRNQSARMFMCGEMVEQDDMEVYYPRNGDECYIDDQVDLPPIRRIQYCECKKHFCNRFFEPQNQRITTAPLPSSLTDLTSVTKTASTATGPITGIGMAPTDDSVRHKIIFMGLIGFMLVIIVAYCCYNILPCSFPSHRRGSFDIHPISDEDRHKIAPGGFVEVPSGDEDVPLVAVAANKTAHGNLEQLSYLAVSEDSCITTSDSLNNH